MSNFTPSQCEYGVSARQYYTSYYKDVMFHIEFLQYIATTALPVEYADIMIRQ